jgi:DNA-binding HxlR family transcriptional regulator
MLTIDPPRFPVGAARDERLAGGAREQCRRGDVERDQPFHVAGGCGDEVAVDRHAGIVDEQGDGGVFTEAGGDGGDIGGVGEIGAQHGDGAAGLLAQACGERLQPGGVTRDEDEVVTAPGEPVGIDGADAGGRAGDERGLVESVNHSISLALRPMHPASRRMTCLLIVSDYLFAMDTDTLSCGPCAIGRSIARVGDAWSMLVLRDAGLGQTRFDGFQKSLGIAPNILTRRLAALVEAGLLERRRYSERPPRDEYVLTAAGRDYVPILLMLGGWARTHFGDEGASRPFDRATGRTIRPVVVDAETGTPLADLDIGLEMP